MTLSRIVGLIAAMLLSIGAVAPAERVFDQSGATFALDQVVGNKTAVYAFVFTGCSNSCPIIGQKLARVQRALGDRSGRDVVFIGVSVDPINDRLPEMKAFTANMGLGRGWHFINGPFETMQRIRNRLGGGELGGGHANFLIIRNERNGKVVRVDALATKPEVIAQRVLAAADSKGTRAEGTARYFRAGALTTADGRKVDFYADVLAGKVTVINTIFTRCNDACPLITQKLVRTRKLMGQGADAVRFVSISNDPAFDTPAKLRTFAAQQGIAGDWVLLTGADADVRTILSRFNLAGQVPGDHGTALIVGNDRSGSWRRVSPAIEPADLARLLGAVVREKAG